MNAKFTPRQTHSDTAVPTAPDDLIPSAPPTVEDRACCCPARPVVRVVMPPSPTRNHETDLLLCGHHYRASCAALFAADAAIHELG